MQALTPAVSLCYASADREKAEAVADFLERCGDARVHLEDGEVRPGDDVAERARDARTADALVILFTRELLPRPWPRSRWEGPLINEPAEEGVRVAFGSCDDCAPPRVLAPQFDLREVAGLRSLKRWLRDPHGSSPPGDAALSELGSRIADRPGCATAHAAAGFVRAFRLDFDAVLRLECEDRSLAAMAGDLGAQLGMRLEGPLEDNLARLREFCEARRFLIVLEGGTDLEAQALIFGGRTSTLITESVAGANGDDPLRLAQLTLSSNASDWAAYCTAARQGRRLANEQGRIAECYELMQHWREAADACGDRVAAEEAVREMVWILEQWGAIEEARDLEYERSRHYGRQMMLAW